MGNQSRGNKDFQTLTCNLSGVVRHAKMGDRDYLVAPMTMIVEGVLNGSNGPLFYPAEELRKVPAVWNHKPIVVYHPEMNGQGISACDPDVLSVRGVGVVMNTRFVPAKEPTSNRKAQPAKLKAEAWLEVNRLSKIDKRVLEAIESNTMMELSTGLFTENELVEGEFNGKEYKAIARNFRPDHLALLPDKKGACSIEDGAGLLQQNELSYESIRESLQKILNSGVGDKPEVRPYVVDVFKSTFVFEKGGKLYRQEYTIDKEKVQTSGVPVVVVRRYEYLVVNDRRRISGIRYEDLKMKTELIENLVKGGKWSESDREFLGTLSEEGLQHLADKTKAEIEEEEKKKKEAEKEVIEKNEEPITVNEKKEGEPSKAVTAEQFIANAPSEIQEVLNHGLKTHQAVRASLIERIMANKANTFTKNALEAKSISDLEGIASLCPVEETQTQNNFVGKGPVASSHKEEPLTLPVFNWDKK